MFDGHGGKGAADLAAATLYQELWKYITLHKEKGLKPEDEDALITRVIRFALLPYRHSRLAQAFTPFCMIFRESFHSTNNKICQTLNLIGDFSGTTVLMTWIVGQKLVVANAGDSRAVLYKDSGKTDPFLSRRSATIALLLTVKSITGKIVRLSKDHRPEDPEEKQRIEALGGRVVTLPQVLPSQLLSEAAIR